LLGHLPALVSTVANGSSHACIVRNLTTIGTSAAKAKGEKHRWQFLAQGPGLLFKRHRVPPRINESHFCAGLSVKTAQVFCGKLIQ